MHRMVEKTKIKILLIIISILVVIFIPFIYHKFHYQATHYIIKDASVSTDIVNVGAQSVSGRIKKLYATETDSVKKGMLLALIEDTNYKNEMDLRRIQVDIAQTNYEKIKNLCEKIEKMIKDNNLEISYYDIFSSQQYTKQPEESYNLEKDKLKEALLQLDIAISHLKKAEKDYKRYSKLFKEHAISRIQFNAVFRNYNMTKAELDAKKTNLINDLLYSKKKSLKELEKAKKIWELAQYKFAQTRITSPLNGIIAKKFLNEGDFVSQGTAIYAIYDPNNIFVIANLKAIKLKYAKLNETVDIKAGGYKRKFNGKIVKIGNIATAENTSKAENSARKILIKIKILNDDKHLLKPGMPVIIVIKRGVK